MTLRDDEARREILERLNASRAEISRLLEAPRQPHADGDSGSAGSEPGDRFPRSKTMQLLMSGRGIGAVGAVVGGVLLARPALALRLLRMVPVGAVARLLAIRAFASMRARQGPPKGR